MTIKSIKPRKHLFLFEKEKGGTGSTGSLATAAHVAMKNGANVVFIEASTNQLDIENAYQDHHPVRRVELTDSDASDQFLDIVVEAPEGSVIFANIPGGRFNELDEVHNIIRFALQHKDAPEVDVTIVWTMGLDKASRVTLDAMLDGDPPGRVLLNLPSWHGDLDMFTEVDDSVVERIAATGGFVYQTPSLGKHLYSLFRSRELALDRFENGEGVSFGNRMAFGAWEEGVLAALGDIF